MKRNWIVLVFALLALASCSVEKRVYQPGYHIEWNHYAKQDVEQDAAQDDAQDATQDVAQDASQDLSENLSSNLSENLEIDVAQDAPQELSQNLSSNLSENLSSNLESNISQALSQNIDSDLEMILLILLALFLPALTIFLLEGFSKNFWIALVLMILAFTLPVPLFLQLLIEGLAIVLAIAVVLHYL